MSRRTRTRGGGEANEQKDEDKGEDVCPDRSGRQDVCRRAWGARGNGMRGWGRPLPRQKRSVRFRAGGGALSPRWRRTRSGSGPPPRTRQLPLYPPKEHIEECCHEQVRLLVASLLLANPWAAWTLRTCLPDFQIQRKGCSRVQHLHAFSSARMRQPSM